MILRIAAYVAVIAVVIWGLGELAGSPDDAPGPLPRMPPLEPEAPDERTPAAEPEPAEPEPEPGPPRKKGGLLGVPLG